MKIKSVGECPRCKGHFAMPWLPPAALAARSQLFQDSATVCYCSTSFKVKIQLVHYCMGYGSYIAAHKFIWTKSWQHPKYQGSSLKSIQSYKPPQQSSIFETAARSMCPGQTFISPISFSGLGGHQAWRHYLVTIIFKLIFFNRCWRQIKQHYCWFLCFLVLQTSNFITAKLFTTSTYEKSISKLG